MHEIYPWQQRQWRQLLETQASGRLPHALLLTGPQGTGIDDFAECLAAYLLCREKSSDQACGSCRSCVLYSSANHPDMYHLEPEETGKQIKVDDIRGLINFIQLSSQYAAHKVALIKPAEAMNRNAANALLKTLEEPPPEVVFLLVSTQAQKLPVTIRSRCQSILFSRVNQADGLHWLTGVTGASEEDALCLLDTARGRPVLAREMAETRAPVHQQQVLTDLGQIAEGTSDVTGIAQRWLDYGAVDVFRWLLEFYARMARMKLGANEPAQQVSRINRDLQRIVNQLHLSQLVECHDMAMQQYRAVTGPFNLNRMGLLEDFIIYWQTQIGTREEKR